MFYLLMLLTLQVVQNLLNRDLLDITVKLCRRKKDDSMVKYGELARIRKETIDSYLTAIFSKACRKQQNS
jgi:hypothetical protein